MYPTIKTPPVKPLSQNLHTPISHPTQRRCPSHHLHHRKLNLSPSHPAQRRWLIPHLQTTGNSAFPPSHPAQRRWLIPHLQTTGNSAFPPSHPAQRRWLIQLPGIHSILQPSSIPTSASRPTPPPLSPARLPGVRHPPSAIHHPPQRKSAPAAHPAHKERSPNFHQLTIIHDHLRSAYNPIRSHQI